MDRETICTIVRNYIFENFFFGYSEEDLLNEQSFLALGILDSTGIMEIVAFLEQEFEIDIKDEEIVPKNLDSVDLIAQFVMLKKNI